MRFYPRDAIFIFPEKAAFQMAFHGITLFKFLFQMNQRLEYQILSMVKARETVPKWINWSTAFGRCALLGATAYTVTWGIDKLVQAKFMRDIKRYKW